MQKYITVHEQNSRIQWPGAGTMHVNKKIKQTDSSTRDSTIGQSRVTVVWHRSHRHHSNLPWVEVHKFYFSVLQLISSYPPYFEKLLEIILSIRRRAANLISALFTSRRNSVAGVRNITFWTTYLTWTSVPGFLLHNTLTYSMIKTVRIQVRWKRRL